MAESRPVLHFLPTDFERFREELQRDPVHNAARLEVRRKLEAIGKEVARALTGGDLTFTSRASLHHPFRFNAFRVDRQSVYLSRGDRERKDLKRILGVELGQDLDQNYAHVLLTLEIDCAGLTTALRVHKDAWWDGENLKRGAASAAGREELARRLRDLEGYGLRIHDYRRVHSCPGLNAAEIQELVRYYKPGDHWLHIVREWSREDPFVTEEGLVPRVEAEFRRLLPAYRWIRWAKSNNRLFSE